MLLERGFLPVHRVAGTGPTERPILGARWFAGLLRNRRTAIVKVGRRVEIRASAGYRNAEEVDALFDQSEREVAKLGPGTPHVTVVASQRVRSSQTAFSGRG